MGYAKNQSHNCYHMWNPASHKITESRDLIWLHCMYYQEDVTADMVMLPEIRIKVHKISQDMIASMQLEGPMICESGGVDPVHDDTELELVTSNEGNNGLPALKVESEAREGEDDDAVTEASDSDTEAKMQTGSV